MADAVAPEHLELVGGGGDGTGADRVLRGGLRLRRERTAGTAFGDYVAGSNHVLPTGGAAPFQSALSGSHLPAPHGSRILPRRGRGPPRASGRSARARRGLPRPRRIDGAPRVTRSADISRKTNETDIELSLALDGEDRGGRTLDRRRVLRPPAGRPRPPRAPRSRPQGRGRPGDRGRITRSRTRASRSGAGPRRSARRPRRYPPLRPRRRTDGRGARTLHARHLRPAVLPPSKPSFLRSRESPTSMRDLTRGFLPGNRQYGEADAARGDRARGTNAHHMIEAAFKAFASRFARRCRLRPRRDGHPVDEGAPVETEKEGERYRHSRLRDGESALGGQGARARRRRAGADEPPRAGARSRRDRPARCRGDAQGDGQGTNARARHAAARARRGRRPR